MSDDSIHPEFLLFSASTLQQTTAETSQTLPAIYLLLQSSGPITLFSRLLYTASLYLLFIFVKKYVICSRELL